MDWCIEDSWATSAFETLSRMDLTALNEQYRSAMTLRSSRMQDPETPPYTMRGGVAIHTVKGPLTKEMDFFSWYFNGTTYTDLEQSVLQATADPNVTCSVVYFDSPGGMAAGMVNAAEVLARCQAIKPIYGYVSDLCASAAYGVASQCTALYGNTAAMAGSLGTYRKVIDSSKAAADNGYKCIIIKAGDMKGIGESGTVVTAEQRAEFQRVVDAQNAEFMRCIQDGRGWSDEHAAAMNDGRIHLGQSAIALGLLDGIGALDDVINRVQAGDKLKRLPAPLPAAQSGKEKKATMGFLDAMKGLLAGYKAAGADTTDEKEKAAIVALEAAVNGGTPVAVPAPAPVTDPAVTAQLAAMTAQMTAQNTAMEAMRASMAQERADFQYTQDCLAVDGLVRAMKMTPAQAETVKALAKENPAGFKAALPTYQAAPVIPSLAGTNLNQRVRELRKGPAPVDAPAGDQLAAKATEIQKANPKMTMAEAMRQAAIDYPELALSHKQGAPRVDGGRE